MEVKDIKNLPQLSKNGEESILGLWIKANEENDEMMILKCEFAMVINSFRALNLSNCMPMINSVVKNMKPADKADNLMQFLTTDELEKELIRRRDLSPKQKAREGVVTFSRSKRK